VFIVIPSLWLLKGRRLTILENANIIHKVENDPNTPAVEIA
jgi:hypothetical protein